MMPDSRLELEAGIGECVPSSPTSDDPEGTGLNQSENNG